MLGLDICTMGFVEDTIASSPEGKNTKFLKSSHNLWRRFHNYESNPPWVLHTQGDAHAFVFATQSKRSKYINLYEIVTCEGKEGRGYAGSIWEMVMNEVFHNGMERLKISCTPDSVTWHKRNGLVFWAVDPTGSLRSDQPLFPNRPEQLTFREIALKDPAVALPTDKKVLERLRAESLESHGFGPKKTAVVEKAIQDVGEYWLRDALMQTSEPSLEEFM